MFPAYPGIRLPHAKKHRQVKTSDFPANLANFAHLLMMKRPDQISLSEFTYDLPEERIAKFPLPHRDRSKLLVYRNGRIGETVFHELPEILDSRYLLVFNDTRVIHARMKFRKSSGAAIEIFCLEPVDPADHQLSFGSRGENEWKCLVGNARKWKDGEALTHAFSLRRGHGSVPGGEDRAVRQCLHHPVQLDARRSHL